MEAVIERLSEKISQLIARYEHLESENRQLKERLASCDDIIIEKDRKIKELTNKLDNLQLTGAFKDAAGSSSEAGRKVDFLIKEIDKCIAMLNE